MADTRNTGSISSHAAVKVFSGARVSPATLADIWRIANVEESDQLSKQVIGVAVRLIGHAQKNKSKKVHEDWVKSREFHPSINDVHVLTSDLSRTSRKD